MARQQKKTSGRNIKRKVSKGVVHIKATFNNTIVSITDPKGEVIVVLGYYHCSPEFLI